MKTVKQMTDMLGNRIRIGDRIAVSGNPYKPTKQELQVLKVDRFEERETKNGKVGVFAYTEEYGGVGFPSSQIVKVHTPKTVEER